MLAAHAPAPDSRGTNGRPHMRHAPHTSPVRAPLASFLSACLGLGLLALAACRDSNAGDATAGAVGPLRFTAIPSENTTELTARFRPLADHLAAELGVDVEYVPSTDYAASVEMFAGGDVQLAWFGGLTGVQARRAVPGATAIAQGVVDPAYKSYFIARRDAGIVPSEEFPLDLAELSFTFGSPGSTSGRMMPEYFIRVATGQTSEAFFGRPMQFSGSHDLTWQQVQSGAVEAGVLDYKTFDRDLEAGEIDPDVVQVVWVTPDYPDYNWTAAPSIDERFGPGTLDRLTEVLVGIEDTELLAALNRPEGLIPASNAQFAALEELALELELVR